MLNVIAAQRPAKYSNMVYSPDNGFRIKSGKKLSEYNCNQDLVSSKTENQIGFSISESKRSGLLWENMISKRTYRLDTPDYLIREKMKMFREWKIENVLDIGCGLGRHVHLFAKYGYQVLGLDVALSALRNTRQSTISNSPVQLANGDVSTLPIKSGSFSLALAWRMLHLNRRKQIEISLREIERVLRPNGIVMCSVRSTINSLYYQAKDSGHEVEQNTFVMKSENIHGLTYHFFSLDEVNQLFSKYFNIISIEEQELEHTCYTESVDTHRNMFWIMVCRKR